MIITTVSGTDTLKLDTVKKHLNIDFTDDDDYLKALITTSLVASENYCRDNFLERLNVQNIGKFSDGMLPLCLPTDITYKPTDKVTIKYEIGAIPTEIVVDELNLYTQDTDHYYYSKGVIYIVLAEGVAVDAGTDVTIEWNTGAVEPDATVDQARLLLCGTYYENRENAVIGTITAQLPNGVKFLLEPLMRPQVG